MQLRLVEGDTGWLDVLWSKNCGRRFWRGCVRGNPETLPIARPGLMCRVLSLAVAESMTVESQRRMLCAGEPGVGLGWASAAVGGTRHTQTCRNKPSEAARMLAFCSDESSALHSQLPALIDGPPAVVRNLRDASKS